jgi:hypothetical protein
MQSTVKLLPCPFCGGEAISRGLVIHPEQGCEAILADDGFIHCDQCHVMLCAPAGFGNVDVKAVWNRRAMTVEYSNTRK